MGQKYSSQSSTGYNSSPPADDGSTTAANKITWATVKTKLSDVLKTFIEAVNSALVTALDTTATATSVNYTTLVGDHQKPIETTGTITISLGDATAMAAGYQVPVYNKGTGVVTIAVITAANTLGGSANGTIKLLPGEGMMFAVNQAVNGYDIIWESNRATIRLTGVAGTNTVTASCDSLITGLSNGQRFSIIPAVTNTGATTLNITPSGGSALTAKNVFAYGAACAGGELVAGVVYTFMYDGTQFNIINPSAARLTNALGADVLLNNIANYFDGPSVAQGTVGTWFVSGSITVQDTAGAAFVRAKLWDGTTVIASGHAYVATISGSAVISLSGYISAPAGNLRISARDQTSTSGLITFNLSGNSKDATITAIRIA